MGLSEEEIDKRVRSAASFVGLKESYFETSPFELSGGQKRRVAIAGVIAMNPDCLLYTSSVTKCRSFYGLHFVWRQVFSKISASDAFLKT